MNKIRGMRWYMVALVTFGLIINYLARSILAFVVTTPEMMKEIPMTHEQYSYIGTAWQLCYAFTQPIAGFILDSIGTKMGFAIFAGLWSLSCAAAALAMNWQGLAFFRGLLGLSESAGIPAGVKASTEWFPAKERSIAIGWFNIGSSFGALLAGPLVAGVILYTGSWRWTFVTVGLLGLIWTIAWLIFYKHPKDQQKLSDDERDYIIAGQEKDPVHLAKKKASLKSVFSGWSSVLTKRKFWGIGIPRFLSEPAWQTFGLWIPLYMKEVYHMDLKHIVMLSWLPFLVADIGCVVGGYLSPFFHNYCKVSLLTSRKLVVLFGCLCMVGPGCLGLVHNPYVAIGLFCIGGFAHQILSGGLYSVTSDVFSKTEVATATGLGGMFGYLGGAMFTLLFGHLLGSLGYSPLFFMLSIFDLVAAVMVFLIVREYMVIDPKSNKS